MQKRHRIRFPRDGQNLEQDEAYFFIYENGKERKIRFHDYDQLYKIPGLYEQIFYDRLKCNSPAKVTKILEAALKQTSESFSELRVLDLGAGNGIMGKSLKEIGVSRLIGADIIKEAYNAMIRDRAWVYDDYYVEDFCNLDEEKRKDIESWQLNCLTTVAALGFGDIPLKAFIEAFNLITSPGWIAFNIKETFLVNTDDTGFSKMVRELIFSKYLDIYYLERYRHRLSIDGMPIFYFAIAGRKNANVPLSYLESKGLL